MHGRCAPLAIINCPSINSITVMHEHFKRYLGLDSPSFYDLVDLGIAGSTRV